MNLIQGGIENIIKMLSSAPTIAAQKEHLDWLRDQLKAAETKLNFLEKENSRLNNENNQLVLQLSSLKKEPEYLDLGICSLKANSSGGYFLDPLCSSCKKPLSPFSNGKFFVCASCALKIEAKAIRAALIKIPKS